MLGPAYNWRESEDGWFLGMNYGCVANVKPMPADERGRRARVRIEHFGKTVSGPAGGLDQGKRYVEDGSLASIGACGAVLSGPAKGAGHGQAHSAPPPGGFLSVQSPTEESRRCELQFISPEGFAMAFSHEADRLACDLTRQLQHAIDSNEVEGSLPGCASK